MTSTSDADPGQTRDVFLGGRIHLWQPRKGYRAGIDPVLLAAACPAEPNETVLDLGCGVGAAALCLHARVPGLSLTGVEVQPDYAELARRNGTENGAAFEVIMADVAALPTDLRQRRFDHVICNPPYFDPAAGPRSGDKGRGSARHEGAPIATWLDSAARRLVPRGRLTLIQRTTRLPEVLSALPATLGSVIVRPVTAREGRESHLFLMQARQGGRAGFRLSAPLVMHAGPEHLRDGDDFAQESAGILRRAQPLSIAP